MNELEALQAIYMEQFEGERAHPLRTCTPRHPLTFSRPSSLTAADAAAPDTKFSLVLKPTVDDSEKCWVSVRMHVQWPPGYPIEDGPHLRLSHVLGLNEGQVADLTRCAHATAAENAGAPAVYAIAERVREWLVEQNEQPSDGSAFDEMMKRQRAKDKGVAAAAEGGEGKAGAVFDRDNDPSIKKRAVVSAAEEDEETRRRKYGTPVTREAFFAWRDKFEVETLAKRAEDLAAGIPSEAFFVTQPPVGRLSGRQMFERDSSLATSDVALAAAAERAGGEAVAGKGNGAPDSAALVGDESHFLAGELDDEDDEDYEPSDEDDEEEWVEGEDD